MRSAISRYPHRSSGPFERFVATILPAPASAGLEPRFRAMARQASVRGGEAPFAGCRDDRIVFVAAGATKLVAQASLGREQIVAFHFAGDLVSVPGDAAHAYTLTALVACDLVSFPSREFLQVARGEPALVGDILVRALEALARCREKSINLGRKTAQERLASFLAGMATRIGTPDGDGCELDLPMSRRDIADSLGLTIETVSRQLAELRELGLVTTSGRSIVRLVDVRSLSELAGHLSAG